LIDAGSGADSEFYIPVDMPTLIETWLNCVIYVCIPCRVPLVNRQIGRRRSCRWNTHTGLFRADVPNRVRQIGDKLKVIPHAPVQGQIGPQLPRVVQKESVVVVGEDIPEGARETRLDQVNKLIEAVPVLSRFCVAGKSPPIQIQQPIAEDNIRRAVGTTRCSKKGGLSGPSIDGSGRLIGSAGIHGTSHIILNDINVITE